jgi:hypothetical protein
VAVTDERNDDCGDDTGDGSSDPRGEAEHESHSRRKTSAGRAGKHAKPDAPGPVFDGLREGHDV